MLHVYVKRHRALGEYKLGSAVHAASSPAWPSADALLSGTFIYVRHTCRVVLARISRYGWLLKTCKPPRSTFSTASLRACKKSSTITEKVQMNFEDLGKLSSVWFANRAAIIQNFTKVLAKTLFVWRVADPRCTTREAPRKRSLAQSLRCRSPV